MAEWWYSGVGPGPRRHPPPANCNKQTLVGFAPPHHRAQTQRYAHDYNTGLHQSVMHSTIHTSIPHDYTATHCRTLYTRLRHTTTPSSTMPYYTSPCAHNDILHRSLHYTPLCAHNFRLHRSLHNTVLCTQLHTATTHC